MTKLTVLHVLFNISTAITTMWTIISHLKVYKMGSEKIYLIMKAEKFLVKESEIVKYLHNLCITFVEKERLLQRVTISS